MQTGGAFARGRPEGDSGENPSGHPQRDTSRPTGCVGATETDRPPGVTPGFVSARHSVTPSIGLASLKTVAFGRESSGPGFGRASRPANVPPRRVVTPQGLTKHGRSEGVSRRSESYDREAR